METQYDLHHLQSLSYEVRLIFGGEAIIAGGAVRDTVTGKPVKDIDIFVMLTDDDDKASEKFAIACAKLAKELGGELELDCSPESYGGQFDLARVTVKEEGEPDEIYEIIGIWEEYPDNDVHDYDFGLSQMFVTSSGLFMTPAAAKDLQNKTITYMHAGKLRDSDNRYRSKMRLARLRAKYQDWTFVNCEVLDAIPEKKEIPAVPNAPILFGLLGDE